MARVGVVIPCYNGGAYLQGALQSLKAQTWSDFEVVVVDDGSDDAGTLRALEDMDGVRLVRQENKGLPAARNVGMTATKADLLLPLDCDDRLEPEFLEKTVAALDADPQAAFAFTYLRMTGDKQGVLAKDYNFFVQLFLNQLPYCMLLRREAWSGVGGYDETMDKGYEDWEFNIRLGAGGFYGAVVPEPLFIYRVSAVGMLQAVSTRLHAQLWLDIQQRHPGLYSRAALGRIRREWSRRPGPYSPWKLMALLEAHRLLPAAVFNKLFARLQRYSASAYADRGEPL